MLRKTIKLQCLLTSMSSKKTTNLISSRSTLLRRFSDETTKAREAAANTSSKPSGTIFDKIISKDIPADIIYEDNKCLAFNDIAPQAPVHFLVIPKVDVVDKIENSVPGTGQQTLGHLLTIAGKLGKERAPNGFRIVINNGVEGCQSVYHLHLHVLGGRQLKWPPG